MVSNYTDEQAWVERANKLLEGRLKAIAERKNKWLEVAKTYTPRSNLEPIWRKETRRIQVENEYLARRLVNPSSDFSVQRFREDYRQVQEYKKHLSKDLYLKNRSMRTLGPLKTDSSQSLFDVPISDQNSPKYEQRAELTKISESFEKQPGNKNKLKEGIMRADYEGSDEEIKKKKRLKRRKMFRKSSLDPLKSDRSHKETSSKPSKHHKKHSKHSKHHLSVKISQLPAGSPSQPEIATFESNNSKLDSVSPSSSGSPSASET